MRFRLPIKGRPVMDTLVCYGHPTFSRQPGQPWVDWWRDGDALHSWVGKLYVLASIEPPAQCVEGLPVVAPGE